MIKMINSKITTDIMTTTGFKTDIPPAKVVINNQEITDLETFNKVVDSIKEKDKEIERLNHECDTYLKIATKRKNIIDKLEKWLKEYKIQCKKYDSNSTIGIINCILNKLKELKEGKL